MKSIQPIGGLKYIVTIMESRRLNTCLRPVSWEAFKSFLPGDNQVCTIAVEGGLVRQINDPDGSQLWIVNPKDMVLVTNSVIPSAQDGGKISIAPMGLNNSVSSQHLITITHNDSDVTSEFILSDVPKSVPAALWGAPRMDGSGNLMPPEVNPEKAMVENTLAGFRIRPANPSTPGKPLGKVPNEFPCTQSEEKDAYRWETPDIVTKQGEKAWKSAEGTILNGKVRDRRLKLIQKLGFTESTLDFGELVRQDVLVQ